MINDPKLKKVKSKFLKRNREREREQEKFKCIDCPPTNKRLDATPKMSAASKLQLIVTSFLIVSKFKEHLKIFQHKMAVYYSTTAVVRMEEQYKVFESF